MNTLYHHILKRLLLAAFLMPSVLSAQVTDKCFRARVQTTSQESVDIQLSASDTIPLKNLGVIYALSIDATIEQPREASFVRIVLEDMEGHNYLVAESDRFRNDTSTVQLTGYCEETAQLSGVTPLRLKCYLTNASLHLTDIHASTELPKKAMATATQLRSMKEAQVQNIVDRINEYNVRHHKLWRADLTTAAMLQFQERAENDENIGETDAYLANLIYYTDGFYEIGEPTLAPNNLTSAYIDSFDWRNHHGQDWTTIPKNQWSSSWCTEFAVVGTIESYVNLYYNRHINLDLSEPYLAYKRNQSFNQGSYNGSVFSTAKQYGVIDEDSYPFVDDPAQSWPISEPSCDERIRINNYGVLSNMSDADNLKRTIINNGPCATSFYVSGRNSGHAIGCVGYGKVKPEQMYFYLTGTAWKDTLIHVDDPRIGMDYWICKDSYYNHPDPGIRKRYQGHEGYIYIVLYGNYLGSFYYPTGSIQSLNYTDSDILCEDRDGDGYFNWGIGPKPAHCPSWAAAQPDGDDSDDTKGPMNQYGYCQPVKLAHDTLQISLSLSVGTDFYMRSHIKVQSGGRFLITKELHCYRGVTLTLEPNATLEIDGGLLHNIILVAKPGSHIIIKNGGRLFGNKQQGEIEIPLGVDLEISQGEIKLCD